MTIQLPFRTRPDIGAAGKVTILGESRCSAERMKGYAERRNPDAPDVADLYLEIGKQYGVRGDIAYCQAMLDTRTWTSPPGHPPWRPYAHSIWGEGMSTWTQDRLEKLVELHIQYLQAFTSLDLPENAAPLPELRMSGLMKAELRGSVVCWEDLTGKWVIPGTRYGQDIMAIWRNMMEWHEEGKPLTDGSEDAEQGFHAGNEAGSQKVNGSSTSSENMEWLRGRGLLPSPVPHPGRKVTWHELAELLRKWETSGKS